MDEWGTPDSLAGGSGRRRSDSEAPDPNAPAVRPAAESPAPVVDAARARAVARVRERRELRGMIGSWGTVSAITTGVWLFSGADGAFWPIYPIVGVGIGVAAKARALWARRTEEDAEAEIAAEMRRAEIRRAEG